MRGPHRREGKTISNVLARKRSVSVLEFYKNAQEIRSTLTRFVMNEKHVPKRYRTVKNMDALFSELFLGERWWKECHEQEKKSKEKYVGTKSTCATPTI